jgi:hypothetical protein
MRRREFLKIGGVGGLGLTVGSQVALSALLDPPPASAAFRAHDAAVSMDARRLEAGQAELVGTTVCVTVFGLAPESPHVTERIALDVLFPSGSSGSADLRVHAWAMRAAGETGRPAATHLRVPVTEQGLRLEPSWNECVFPVQLSVGRAPGTPKLRFGDYRLSAGPAPGILVSVDPQDHPVRASSSWRR